MNRNQKLALEMMDVIESCRSGGLPLEELEQKIWRLLDATDNTFPLTVAGQLEDLVLALQRLKRENLAFASARDADEDRGTEVLYNEVVSALSRILG